MTVRWREPKWFAFVTALVIVTLGFYALYIDYAIRHNLEFRSARIWLGNFSLVIPLLAFAVVGLIAAAASIGIYQAGQIATSPRADASIQRWRVLRALLWPLFLFALVLYVPAIVTTDWFWKNAGATARLISQLKDPMQGFTATAQTLAALNPAQSLALFQTTAVILMTLAALVTVRVRRLPVKKKR